MATTSQTTPAAAPAPSYPDQVTGMWVLARSLVMVGIKDMFGLVGIPVTEVPELPDRHYKASRRNMNPA